MFFNKRKPKDIPIDEFVFSPEDIFVLLGGFDPAMFACIIYTMNLSRIAEERPDREEWRRKMIKRFQPHGLVDEEGNPCPALAEALAPLRAREIVVTNGPERTRTIEMRTIELAVAGGRATTLVSERGVLSGRIQGFRIVPLGTDRSAWNKWLAETLETQEIMDAVDASYYPFVGTQILDAQGNGAGMEHGNIFTAIKHGDRDTAKAWGGAAAGADPQAFDEAARVLGHIFMVPRILVTEDYRGCTCEQLNGIDLPGRPIGPYRYRQLSLYQACGIDFSFCCSQRPGYPPDWPQNDALKSESTFITVNFYRETPLVDAITTTYPYPAA